jgi:putative FmdB family regulatory protein
VPVYEFFCERCNTIYSFFSRTVKTDKVPACPGCGAEDMKRKISLFAAISGGKESASEDADIPGFDEARMEKAMEVLSREQGGLNEEDPRAAAALMRRLSEAAGMTMGSGMEEALDRLERGEDPEKIGEDMEEILESEEPFIFGGRPRRSGKGKGPRVDETLYEL